MDSEQIDTTAQEEEQFLQIADNEQAADGEVNGDQIEFNLYEKINEKFVRQSTLAVDNINPCDKSEQDLYDVVGDIFINILRLSNTIRGTSTASSLLKTEFATAIHNKIQQIVKMKLADSNVAAVNAQILVLQDKLATLMASIFEANAGRITYHAAHTLVNLLINTMRANDEGKRVSNSSLNQCLIKLGDNLYSEDKPQILENDSHSIAEFIKSQPAQVSIAWIKDLPSPHFKYNLLSHMISQDATLESYLSEKSQELVFNYKNKAAQIDLHYFLQFYHSLSEKSFAATIASQCQFRAKRSADALQQIALMISKLSFDLSPETNNLLTIELLSKEYLTTDVKLVSTYLQAVATKVLPDQSFAQNVLIGFVLKYFNDNKADQKFTIEQRLGVFSVIFKTMDVLINKKVSIEAQLEVVGKTFVEYMLNAKDETDLLIEQNVVDFFNNHVVAKEWFKHLIAENQILKIMTATQSSFFGRLSKMPIDLQITVSNQITKRLLTQNFQSATNSTQILSMLSCLCELGQHDQIVKNEALLRYMLNPASFINLDSFFDKQPKKEDVTNHLNVIQTLLTAGVLKPNQTQYLFERLYEYIFNNKYQFRSHQVFGTIDNLSKDWKAATFNIFLQGLLHKEIAVYAQQQIKVIKKDEDSTCWKTMKNEQWRMRQSLGLILKNILKQQELDGDMFMLVLKTALHPVACSDRLALKQMTNSLEKVFGHQNYYSLFQLHHWSLVDCFLRQRTGILSPDAEVRSLASNVLVAMAWAGHLDKFIQHMVPIFNYRPIEKLEKLEELLESEFEKISHYELMYYAGISKDIFGVFDEKDVQCKKKVLAIVQNKQDAVEEKKEQVKVKSVPIIDTSNEDKLAALLKMKAAMKAAPVTKGNWRNAAPAKPTPAAKLQPQSQPQQQAQPEESKEQRNKKDRQQMLDYCKRMKEIKALHVRTCHEILRMSNFCPMAPRLCYQDLTFNYTISSLQKLLNLSSTRFSSYYFVQNILKESPESPFFAIKTQVLTCLIAISQNKLTSKTTQEFQNSLHYLTENVDFSEMQGGYLQLTLTIANFVLKDPAVNLSVKEVALKVAQDILENNSNVQTIDLVRITINMLKTNYISSNLGQFIRKIMARTSKLEIAMMLQRLHEYQPVPRKTFLNEILAYDEPLFCPVWLQSSIWSLLYDEDLGSLARKIWNKYGFVLTSETVKLSCEQSDKNLFHYLRSQNIGVFNMTVNAFASAMELFQFSHISLIIDDLIQYYHDEWKEIERVSVAVTDEDSSKDLKVIRMLIADERMNRIAVCKIITKVVGLVQPAHFEKIIQHLINDICHDQNSEIKQAASDAAVALIKANGEKHGKVILAILETYLDAKTGKSASELSKIQAIRMLGTLAPFLADLQQKKLIVTFEQLLALTQGPSEEVKRAVCKCMPQLSKYFQVSAKSYLLQQIKIIKESNEVTLLKGAAYAAAGIYKGLGMKELQESGFLKELSKDVFSSKRTDPARRQAALHVYEALSFSMGKSFEVFLPEVFPHILLSISDQKEPVRAAAQSALQQIMVQFSNYAIKQALPTFLKNLEENENWRSKLSTVEALGSMAYCAPKQISSFLPQIVKALRDIMNDTHEKVHNAAIEAIEKIGSVIKCPEVGDMLEIIIKALSNSRVHLNEALHLLLETSFVHAIDAPSLSLLIPLLDNGLMMHDNNSKQMAAQLMGNICSLVKDPSDLLPYIPILMPAIKNSLFDSIPEIRASAAKALGSLSKGLGISNSLEMLSWLREHLNTEGIPTAERLGAAQGFSELISVHGERFFDVNIEEVIIKAKDHKGEIREAYRSVLIFLPNSFDKFVDRLPNLIPLMIGGLADDKDECRKVSMRAIKICINSFARHSPDHLVLPVLRMMFSEDSRVRMSSSILMYQLVKELENDIIKSQPKYVSMETKHKILASMFILKYDPDEKVKTQAGTIWKNIVDNNLLILRLVIETLIHLVFNLVNSKSGELQEMGLSCMRGMVEKFGEKLINQAIDIFETLVESSTNTEHTTGVIRVMFNMTQAATYRLLTLISPRIVSIIDPNLSSDQTEIQEWSSKVLITLFQRQPEKTFIDPILEKSIMHKLKQFVVEKREDEADRLIQTLKFLIQKAPELRIEDRMLILCDLLNRERPFTIAQARVLRALAPTIASKVFTKRFYRTVLEALEAELVAEVIDDQERISYVLMAFAELLTCIPEHEAVITNEEISKFCHNAIQLQRPEFYLKLVQHYCENTATNYENMAAEYLENSLKYLNYPQKELVHQVVLTMNAIFEKLPKEHQFALVPLIKTSIEKAGVDFVGPNKLFGSEVDHMYRKKFDSLEIMKNELGVKSLVSVVQSAIMHGSVEVRIDSAFCFKYILDFTPAAIIKKEIIKICGALIRVVNDKFPQELKLQIFEALKLIQVKGAQSAKAMQTQLQTTFLKAFGDTQSTPQVRKMVQKNLLILVKDIPRIDPIIKELNSLLEGSKIEVEQKEEVSETLAFIIRTKGKAIQSATSQAIYATLSGILQDPTNENVNDKVIANCATALAFLSAISSDPAQMKALFSAFDDDAVDCVILPLKIGVLINGNDAIDKSELVGQLDKLMGELLTDRSGFEEIDEDSACLGDNDAETFKFRNVIEVFSYFMDKIINNLEIPSDSPHIRQLFTFINKSTIFKRLAKEKDISLDSFLLLTEFLQSLPIKPKDGDLTAEMKETLADALKCLQNFYLDHDKENQASTDALLNILQLNCDNYLELDKSIVQVTKQSVKEGCDAKYLQGVITSEMKLYANDIIFKKK